MTPITVLIVDDEQLLRRRLRDLCADMPLNLSVVGEARNGLEALGLVGELSPDVVVTDIKMPVMDGLELIGRLRDTGATAQIVLISGFAEFDYAKRAMQHRVRHYVLKPVDRLELQRALADACESVELTRSAEQLITVEGVDDDEEHSNIERLVSFVDAHFSDDLTVDLLAARFNFSPSYLSTLFRRHTGHSFVTYLTTLRISKAMHLLSTSALSIGAVAEEAGYADQQYFHRVFKKHVGVTPARYRQTI